MINAIFHVGYNSVKYFPYLIDMFDRWGWGVGYGFWFILCSSRICWRRFTKSGISQHYR